MLSTPLSCQPPARLPRTASVLVAGQDPVVTDALSRLLELDTSIHVLGTATGTGAGMGPAAPDVLLYADSSPSATDAVEALREHSPQTVVCVLDALRDLNVGEFLNAVRALSDCQPQRFLRSVPATAKPEKGSTMRAILSPRELEVVRLVTEGLSNKEISARLGLSDKTVKNHISHILAKLNVTARTQVAVMALRAGVA